MRKSTEYHFCIKVTPKVLSKIIFESKGIETLYKLQVNKGSKKQSVETMKRNLHQEALEGFYKSQNCYFTLLNYTNFRPYEMTVTFSEMNSLNQEEMIFTYKFSTFSLVKNFLENGVQRSTNVVTKDFETEFYIDFYIQSNKAMLEETVKYDNRKQILERKHYFNSFEDERDSENYRKSVSSNNSPSKSSNRASSTVHYRMEQGVMTRASTPLLPNSRDGNGWKRKKFTEESVNDNKSEKTSNRSLRMNDSGVSIENERRFIKKFPSTSLNYGENLREEVKSQRNVSGHVNESGVRRRQEVLIEASKSPKSVKGIREKEKEKGIKEKESDRVKNIEYEKVMKISGQESKEFDLRVFLNMREISMEEISYQIKKNILIIIFVSIVFFIVASKAINSIGISGETRVGRMKSRRVEMRDDELDEMGMDELEEMRGRRKYNKEVRKGKTSKKGKKVHNNDDEDDQQVMKSLPVRRGRKIPRGLKSI